MMLSRSIRSAGFAIVHMAAERTEGCKRRNVIRRHVMDTENVKSRITVDISLSQQSVLVHILNSLGFSVLLQYTEITVSMEEQLDVWESTCLTMIRSMSWQQ